MTAVEGKIFEMVKEELKKNGYKLTGPRLAILEYMISNDNHPDMQEIYEGIRADNPGIGMATVYRTVDLFLELGILRALTLRNSRLRYELNRPDDHHHHLICTGCGKVTEFGSCNFRLISGEIEQVTRFKIFEHNLEAYGLCPQCSTNK